MGAGAHGHIMFVSLACVSMVCVTSPVEVCSRLEALYTLVVDVCPDPRCSTHIFFLMCSRLGGPYAFCF